MDGIAISEPVTTGDTLKVSTWYGPTSGMFCEKDSVSFTVITRKYSSQYREPRHTWPQELTFCCACRSLKSPVVSKREKY